MNRLTRADIRLDIESAEHTRDFSLCGRNDWKCVGLSLIALANIITYQYNQASPGKLAMPVQPSA